MTIIRVAFLVSLASVCSGCNTVYPNPATPYVQRTDKVTFGAGDAQDVNTAIQTIDPWPRYAGDRHIPGNGTRMVGAVERYQGGSNTQAPGGSPKTSTGASSAASGTPAAGSSTLPY
jgi:hypothetical protein